MRNRYLRGHYLISPYGVFFISIIFFLLAEIPNPLGWTNAFIWSGTINYTIVFIYLLFLILGIILGGSIANNINRDRNSLVAIPDISIKFLWFLLFVALFFQAAKFVNIGDIPLFGDPNSRYRLTLGGFEDYPSRLLAPVSSLFILIYTKTKKKIYLLPFFLSLSTTAMLMQRQEAVNVILGALFIWFLFKEINLRSLALYGLLTFIVLYVFVGFAAVLRHGAENIMRGGSVWKIAFYILHGDTTTAYIFGQSIVEMLGDQRLYGRYIFGPYISIVNPYYGSHSAEFLRKMYTASTTAQSISVPFSYFVDFGYSSLVALSFFEGLILSYFYKTAIKTKKYSHIIVYITIFLNALWILRAGNLIVAPIVLYIMIGIYSSVRIAYTPWQVRLIGIERLFFVASLAISFVALLVRL